MLNTETKHSHKFESTKKNLTTWHYLKWHQSQSLAVSFISFDKTRRCITLSHHMFMMLDIYQLDTTQESTA